MTNYNRSPFDTLHRLAMYELEDVDLLVKWSEENTQLRKKRLEQLNQLDGPEDQFSDDWGELDSFTQLHAELATVALWRCVELCRKRVIRSALGDEAVKNVFRHQDFCKKLWKLGIEEASLKQAEWVNELRCINNDIKHDGYVGGELAKVPGWESRAGKEIGNLAPHYTRLREHAEAYVADLVEKASQWWRGARQQAPPGAQPL